MRQLLWMLIAALLGLPGCSNISYYADSEQALNTAGYYDLLDHIAAYYPRGIALNFPGYVVGFEEAPRHLVADTIADIAIDESVYEAGYTVKRLTRALRYRTPFISQIMRYEGRPYGEGNCSVYNLYHNHGSTFIPACNGSPQDAMARGYDYGSAYDRSWYAIDLFKSRLQQDITAGGYSHVIVAVMGLDTAQEEAIRNYTSVISSIRLNAGTAFKPLFVGITWPSFYANRWFDPIWEVLSYHPVADRADILGLSWLGVVLHDAIMPLSDRVDISIIGHSFGARAATMGLCVGPGILSKNGESMRQNPRGMIENFVGLAPAFSLTRFIDKDYRFYENVFYRDYCPMIKRFIFTASKEDGAFTPVFWSDAVGDHNYMLKYCQKDHAISVSCINTDTEGKLRDYDPLSKVTYIDTSALMKYTMPGTEGGGHSDIYRSEVGRLLWTVLNGDKR